MRPPPNLQRCPLTVIGGFLGAGKTTLVNHLLAHAQGRYAVLVNDFGAVNVDAGLIAAHDGETLRLTNGCVCCSLSDDFMSTLIRVLDTQDRFDHIIIEASGVGDPWSIAEIALVEPGLRLNAVLVLADAERIAALLDDTRIGDTVRRQVQAADILLLNKADLADRATRDAAAARLAALKPGLRIVPTIAAAVPTELLDEPAPAAGLPRFRAEPATHESLFHRVLYRRAAAFERDKLEAALRGLPPSLLRLKGVCRLDDTQDAMVLQLVGQRWAFAPTSVADAAWPIELVGIATDALAADAVAVALDAALAQVSLEAFEIADAAAASCKGDRMKAE